MRLFLANLLYKYTNCNVQNQGTSVSLIWKTDEDTFSWTLHASKNKRVVISRNRTLKLVKNYSRHHSYYD